jgi:glycerol kinase
MRSDVILAIDQGTTNTKALLINTSGTPIFRTSVPVPLTIPRDGIVEQDPLLLWESVQRAMDAAVQYAGAANAKIAAVAISNQRETALAWNAETGEPLANAVSWQCIRSSAICERLASHASRIRAKTGLPLAPLISASKWAWLLENDARVQAACRQGVLRFGTVDSWLVYKLTRGKSYATDLTNASRTGLLNLESLAWDRDLLTVFEIPETAMPKLHSSSGEFGTCNAIAKLNGIPIMAAVGDSHAAMFGHRRFSPGSVKATYGTGSSLMALTDGLLSDTSTLARTIAWSIHGETQFALEGNIAMTGAAVQWLGEFLGFADPANQVANLANGVSDSGGVYFVPAMVGLGAPHWDAIARGTITGLGRSHTAAHLARAAIEAIAYQVADVFIAMESAAGVEFAELRADGGATRNNVLMQFQADILNRPVVRSENEELSALGAAWLGGLALGWWKSVADLESIASEGERFAPAMATERRKTLYAGWTKAIARTRTCPEIES